MISFDEAWALVAGQAQPLGTEQVALEAAHSRILAEPVVANVDWPPQDASAMDGYAVRDGDRSPLRLIGTSYPGEAFDSPIGAGECVRIFTGAAVPQGADRVIMQEHATHEGAAVSVLVGESDARHIRRRGSDFLAGDMLLAAGRRLDARAMVAAAGADQAAVWLWRKPRVSILGTGDELVEPGMARSRPGTIPNSLSFGVAGLVREWGGEVVARELVPDERRLIRLAAAAAMERADLVIVTGGASVGERDYSKSVFADLGLDLLFAKIAMKPGKPVWFGRTGTALVLGLPGNPTSAMVTARLLLAPLLAGLGGDDPARAAQWRSAVLQGSLGACRDRETFHRACFAADTVLALANQDSGSQKFLAEANSLIRQSRESPAMKAGDMVDIIDF